MSDFASKLELRIDWSEIDLFGHVNNLAIMKYVQAARVLYMDKIGLMQSQYENRIGPILASTSCQFHIPLFYPGIVTVCSKVDYIKNTSFKMLHAVYNDKNEIAAEAQDILVYYDFAKSTKLDITDELRFKLKNP